MGHIFFYGADILEPPAAAGLVADQRHRLLQHGHHHLPVPLCQSLPARLLKLKKKKATTKSKTNLDGSEGLESKFYCYLVNKRCSAIDQDRSAAIIAVEIDSYSIVVWQRPFQLWKDLFFLLFQVLFWHFREELSRPWNEAVPRRNKKAKQKPKSDAEFDSVQRMTFLFDSGSFFARYERLILVIFFSCSGSYCFFFINYVSRFAAMAAIEGSRR